MIQPHLYFHVQSATCFAYEAEVKMTRVGEKLVAYPTQTEPIYNASLRNQLRQFCPKLDDKLQGTTCCGETMVSPRRRGDALLVFSIDAYRFRICFLSWRT